MGFGEKGCKDHCITSCNRDIELDIFCQPELRCIPKNKPCCDFDIDIEFEIKPKCVELVKCGETSIDCNRTCCHYKATLAFDVCPRMTHTQRTHPKCEFEFGLDFQCSPKCSIEGKKCGPGPKAFAPALEEQCGCPACARGGSNW